MSATAIMRELGGTQFQTMTHARDFSYPQNGLAFRLARSTSGIDRVQIIPEADHYTMTFFQGDTEVAIVNGLGGDQLLKTFESHTGQAM